jgi:glycosyltransferase involved in cell wall biosynthesis
MKNLLFISSYPFPLDMGSNQHAYFFIKALSHYFNIYCVFFLAPNKLPFSDTDENLSELNIKDYRLCYFRTPSRSKKIAYLLKRIIAFPNYYMHLAKNPQSLKTINECVKQYSIDIIHFEHFHYTRYAFSIKSNVKKVIVYHDKTTSEVHSCQDFFKSHRDAITTKKRYSYPPYCESGN